jgi:hypothetical protein
MANFNGSKFMQMGKKWKFVALEFIPQYKKVLNQEF